MLATWIDLISKSLNLTRRRFKQTLYLKYGINYLFKKFEIFWKTLRYPCQFMSICLYASLCHHYPLKYEVFDCFLNGSPYIFSLFGLYIQRLLQKYSKLFGFDNNHFKINILEEKCKCSFIQNHYSLLHWLIWNFGTRCIRIQKCYNKI